MALHHDEQKVSELENMAFVLAFSQSKYHLHRTFMVLAADIFNKHCDKRRKCCLRGQYFYLIVINSRPWFMPIKKNLDHTIPNSNGLDLWKTLWETENMNSHFNHITIILWQSSRGVVLSAE